MAEEIADATIGNVGCESKECKRPCQGVEERFLQLVHLEVLVANALLIDPDSLDGEPTVEWTQPACIQLIVRDEDDEEYPNSSCEQAGDKEDDLPRGNR